MRSSGRILTAVVALALAASCAAHVRLAADYDPILDQAVTELYVWTTEFLGEVAANLPLDEEFLDQTAEFHTSAQATVTVLELRSSVLEAGLSQTPLTDNFTNLKAQFAELERGLTPDEEGRVMLDNARVLQSTTEAIDQAFRSILTHLVFLKKDG